MDVTSVLKNLKDSSAINFGLQYPACEKPQNFGFHISQLKIHICYAVAGKELNNNNFFTELVLFNSSNIMVWVSSHKRIMLANSFWIRKVLLISASYIGLCLPFGANEKND